MSTILLAAKQIDAGYGRRRVLEKVSLEIPQGARLFLIGLNASGKSTLLRVLFGILPVWGNGMVWLKGARTGAWGPQEFLRARVALVPQDDRVFKHLTVEENLKVSASFHRLKGNLARRIESSMEVFPILQRLRDRTAETLSGGEQQMLSLAIALVHKPHLLLLDEPFAGLDSNSRQRLREKLFHLNEQAGVTLVVAEHLAGEVTRLATEVVSLRRGQIAGHLTSPGEITSEAVRALLF